MHPHFEQCPLLRATLMNFSPGQEDAMLLKYRPGHIGLGQAVIQADIVAKQGHSSRYVAPRRDSEAQAKGTPIPKERVLEVFGYVPPVPAFTEDEQEAFPAYARKKAKPSFEKMVEAGRWAGRFGIMPGKTHQHMVHNYYNRKYLAGVSDRFPLVASPSQPERSPRKRTATAKSIANSLQTQQAKPATVARASPKERKRKSPATPAPVPAPAAKRARTEPEPVPSPRKRSAREAELEDDFEPARSPEKRRSAGDGIPNNHDDAFLRILKELRYRPAKEAGVSGIDFANQYVSTKLRLIPYEERPVPRGISRSTGKKGKEEKPSSASKRTDKKDGQLAIDANSFELAQVCLLLTCPLLVEQRRRVKLEEAKEIERKWRPNQWQLCGVVDVNKMSEIGRAMEERGMFEESYHPELYDAARVDEDMALLADEEARHRPEGFWPDAKGKPQIRGLLVKRKSGELIGASSVRQTSSAAQSMSRAVLYAGGVISSSPQSSEGNSTPLSPEKSDLDEAG